MARTPAPAHRRRPVRLADSSDDDVASPPQTRRAARTSGGAARGAPAARGRAAAARGRPVAAAAAATRNPARRSGRATAAAGGRAGPIVGGHQNRLRARVNELIAGNGRAYRVGRPRADGNGGNVSNGTIVLDDSIQDDSDDEDEEGDDSFPSISDDDDDDPERPNEYDFEDSFINDNSRLGGGDAFGDIFGSSDEDDDDLGDGLAEETFSREAEEFELMEERENAGARQREERLRKKEDKEEKENKHLTRTDMFGACTICAEDKVTDPVGCLHCAGFVGCRKCANRWYRTSKNNDAEKIASCPLCRNKWVSAVPEVGEMLDLIKTA